MEIGQKLRVTTRQAWRTWLEKNHARKTEIWLVYATKQSGKGRVAYSDAVEEALCFGWIDGIMKKIDANYFAQRFSPRRSAKSQLSETNKERVRLTAESRPAHVFGLNRETPLPSGSCTIA